MNSVTSFAYGGSYRLNTHKGTRSPESGPVFIVNADVLGIYVVI